MLYLHGVLKWASLYLIQIRAYLYLHVQIYFIPNFSLHILAIRYAYLHFKARYFQDKIKLLAIFMSIYVFMYAITYLYTIYILIFSLCISQILVSCFVKTSHYEEYLCVKVRLLSSMSVICHDLNLSIICDYVLINL